MNRILLLVLLIGSIGCRRSGETSAGGHSQGGEAHAHGPESDHEHEVKTAQITVWTNGYEIFAEHTPPVAGEGTRFITHVSELETGKARTNGPMKFILRKGETTFEHPQAAPERPGIYLPSITFPSEGDWQATVIIPGETNALVDLGVIRVFPNDHAAAHAEFSEPPEGITFLKEQQWKILLKSEPMTRRSLVERVPVPAQVRAKPGFSAAITAPLAGQLTVPAEGKFPIPGTRVESGDLLAIIQPRFSDAAARFVEIQAEFGRAEAELKQAQAAYERTKSLVDVQAKSRRELEEAELALASARARHAAASALQSNYAPKPADGSKNPGPALELRAPIAGVITSVGAGLGEPVTADQIVFSILNPSTIWIEARVPESAIGRLETAGGALCQVLDGTNRQFPISAENGRHVFTGLEVDPQTRTVPLIYELNNTNAALRIGQTVRLQVETATAREAVAIPHSALVEDGGLFVAFVQVSGETFQRRELQLGIRDGEWIQVLSGLNPTERVVTQGAYAVRLAAASNVIPAHGHAH